MHLIIPLDADVHVLTGTLCDLGDSFGGRNPNKELQQICRGLEKWLSVAFRVEFKDLGNTFPIGQQADGHSCGICVVNAIEHAMFGVLLFTDGDCYCLRVQYFVEAVKHLLNDVRIMSCTRNKSRSHPFS